MKRNFVLLSILSLVLLLTTAVVVKSEEDSSEAENLPNIIVILTDDQGYNDVGFNGSTEIPTPNIDRIANDGVVFTAGYVSFPVCGPSRAGLLTGRYQDRFGFSRNPLWAPKDPSQGLPLSEETIADALGKAGYQTMAIGKWHMGAHESLRPLNRGFDEFFGFLTGGHHYFPEKWTLKDISEVTSQYEPYKTRLLRNNDRIDEKEYLTDALSREAVNFIERNSKRPFFLYLAYNAPHAPMQATEKYLNRFPDLSGKRKIYAAMVSAVDDGVGNLLNKLEELGLDDNTIVFFLSDNGGPLSVNGSDNGKLRAGKGSLFEGGIRVPFAMQWKNQIHAGQKYDEPVISLDIFATAIAQTTVKTRNKLDGVNLLPFLTGKKTGRPHSQLYWRKFDSQGIAVRAGNMKLIRDDSLKNYELFDLSSDLSEKNALSDTVTEVNLKVKFEYWNEENQAPAFMGLQQNMEYNKINPDRFSGVEKY